MGLWSNARRRSHEDYYLPFNSSVRLHLSAWNPVPGFIFMRCFGHILFTTSQVVRT